MENKLKEDVEKLIRSFDINVSKNDIKESIEFLLNRGMIEEGDDMKKYREFLDSE